MHVIIIILQFNIWTIPSYKHQPTTQVLNNPQQEIKVDSLIKTFFLQYVCVSIKFHHVQ